MAAILSLEREFAAGHQDEASFRTQTEEMAARSLFTAARGMDRPGGVALDEPGCLERGQFMSGACAGLISEAKKLQAFHRELAEGSLVLHQHVVGSIERSPETPSSGVGRGLKRVAPRGDDCERVAVTGMSIVNTLGNSPGGILGCKPGHEERDHFGSAFAVGSRLYYDPRPQVPVQTYCKVGAFLDFRVSRNELGIPPHDFRTMTEATRVTMWLADRAIRASGILDSDIPRERIGVLISQNSGEAAGSLADMIIREYVHDILGAVKRAVLSDAGSGGRHRTRGEDRTHGPG